MTTKTKEIDSRFFRNVLGNYPTGVAIVTAMVGGEPVGMTVGSFTSVSLDPPLVAFFPDKSSGTWAQLRKASSVCINILASDQESVCRAFARKDPDRFESNPWTLSAGGAPILTEAVSWIDCVVEDIVSAGDHHFVLCAVQDLALQRPSLPLLFFQGGYGRFSPVSLVAGSRSGLLSQIRQIALIRHEMEELARTLNLECIAMTTADGHEVQIATAGAPDQSSEAGPTSIGVRLPLARPVGAMFVAWADEPAQESWIGRGLRVDTDELARHKRSLHELKERGWQMSLDTDVFRELDSAVKVVAATPDAAGEQERLYGILDRLDVDYEGVPDSSEEIPLRTLGAPVFGPDGNVVFTFALSGFPPAATTTQITGWLDSLLAAADRATTILGGKRPE